MVTSNEVDLAALLEKDTYGDYLWTWAYPSISESQREFVKRQICTVAESNVSVKFWYSQWRRQWYYILISSTGDSDKVHKLVTYVFLLIVAKDFNPEKYQSLGDLFLKSYKSTGSPATMLQSYLSIYTKGQCKSDNNGMFVMKDFSSHAAYSHGDIKDLIHSFGIETILLYTAMLLKKRIVVYHSDLTQLLQCIRVIPALVWHRQNWAVLFPYIDETDEELSELKKCSSYVAGFTRGEVENREDLYDLFVNISNNEITIAAHAKETFAMGKLHKDMAKFIVQCGESSEDSSIQDIASKTRELLNNLHSLSSTDSNGEAHITLEGLKARKMPATTENFLYRLAVCEGFVKF